MQIASLFPLVEEMGRGGGAGGVGDPAEAESAANEAMESNRKMFVGVVAEMVAGVIKLLLINILEQDMTLGVLTAELGPNSPAPIIGLEGNPLGCSWNGEAKSGETGGGLKNAAAAG